MPEPADRTVPDVATRARQLAAEHGAVVLAAALVERLRLDGYAELAATVASLLSGAAIDPNPPNPYREAPAIDPNPPHPHREGSSQ
jgi:hypothetical protein